MKIIQLLTFVCLAQTSSTFASSQPDTMKQEREKKVSHAAQAEQQPFCIKELAKIPGAASIPLHGVGIQDRIDIYPAGSCVAVVTTQTILNKTKKMAQWVDFKNRKVDSTNTSLLLEVLGDLGTSQEKMPDLPHGNDTIRGWCLRNDGLQAATVSRSADEGHATILRIFNVSQKELVVSVNLGFLELSRLGAMGMTFSPENLFIVGYTKVPGREVQAKMVLLKIPYTSLLKEVFMDQSRKTYQTLKPQQGQSK